MFSGNQYALYVHEPGAMGCAEIVQSSIHQPLPYELACRPVTTPGPGSSSTGSRRKAGGIIRGRAFCRSSQAAFGFVGFLASGRDASLSDKTIGRVPVTDCDSGLRREMGPDETAIYFHRGLKSD